MAEKLGIEIKLHRYENFYWDRSCGVLIKKMIVFYYNKSVVKFIQSLDKHLRSDVYKTVNILGEYGSEIELPHSRSLGQGLFELRSVGSGVRMLYCFSKESAVILLAFIKKQDKIPKKDLDLARKRQYQLA